MLNKDILKKDRNRSHLEHNTNSNTATTSPISTTSTNVGCVFPKRQISGCTEEEKQATISRHEKVRHTPKHRLFFSPSFVANNPQVSQKQHTRGFCNKVCAHVYTQYKGCALYVSLHFASEDLPHTHNNREKCSGGWFAAMESPSVSLKRLTAAIRSSSVDDAVPTSCATCLISAVSPLP